jgi:hypothetical protein
MYYSTANENRRECSRRAHVEQRRVYAKRIESNSYLMSNLHAGIHVQWSARIPLSDPIIESVARFTRGILRRNITAIPCPQSVDGQESRNLLLVGIRHDPRIAIIEAAQQCGVAFLDANDSIMMGMSDVDENYAVAQLFEYAACCQPVIVYIGNCSNLLPVNPHEKGRASVVSTYRYYMGNLSTHPLHSQSTGVIVVGYTDQTSDVDAGAENRCRTERFAVV